MDQGEGETDGQTGETGGGQLIGGANDHQQEEEGEHKFHDQGRPEAVATGGMGAKTVGGQRIAAAHHQAQGGATG